jgi:hypothetical protein
VTAGETYLPSPRTATLTLRNTFEQVVSLAAYSENVILPVGEDPPLSTAVSRIVPPEVGAADPLVDSANLPGRLGVATGCAAPVTSVTTVVGAGPVEGAMAGAGQFAIVRLVEPEPDLPSRVSAGVHDDDAVATPLPLGTGIVSDDALSANDVVS